MKIEVTNIRKSEDEFDGKVTIIINDSIVIENISVYNNVAGKLTVSFPVIKGKGKNTSIFVFKSREIENEIKEKIIDAYNCNEISEGISEEMHVTDVSIMVFKGTKTKGIASVTLNDFLEIRLIDFKQKEKIDSLDHNVYEIYMHTYNGKENTVRKTIYSINSNLTKEIIESIYKKYKEEIEEK